MSAGVLVALALGAALLGLLPGEKALYDAIVGRATPGVVAVFWWVNQLGNKWVLAPGVALLLWAVPGARRRWWLWLAVLIAAPVLEDLGKQVVGRPRPVGNAFGFPSGHVTAATAYFFLAAYLVGQRLSTPRRGAIILWVIAGLTVALVGVARIVLQAHWPADAIGGAALGLACVSLAAWWHERQGGGRGGAT